MARLGPKDRRNLLPRSLLIATAIVLSASSPLRAQEKQRLTEQQVKNVCASVSSGYNDYMSCMDDQWLAPERAKKAEKAARQAAYEAIPVGAGMGWTVNGVEIMKCSHGYACMYQLEEVCEKAWVYDQVDLTTTAA